MGYISTPAYTSRADAEGASGQPLTLDGLGAIRAYEIPAAGGPIQIVVEDAGVGGLRKSFKKAVKKVSAPVKKVAKAVAKPVQKVAKAVAQAPRIVSSLVGGAKATATADGGVQYTDENGNPITEAQYNALMAQQNAPAPAYPVQPYQAQPLDPWSGAPAQPSTGMATAAPWAPTPMSSALAPSAVQEQPRAPYPWEEDYGPAAMTDAAPEDYGTTDEAYGFDQEQFEGLGDYLNQVQREDGVGWLDVLTNMLPAITQAGTGVAQLVFARKDAKEQQSQAAAQTAAASKAAAAEEMKAKAALIEAEKMKTSAAAAGSSGTKKALLIGGAVTAVVVVGLVIYLATRNRAPKA